MPVMPPEKTRVRAPVRATMATARFFFSSGDSRPLGRCT